MAAGSAFTLVPNEVITEEPEYHNVITESESMKKDYQNISTTKVQKYELRFKALINANRDILLTHYEDQYGDYHSFSWQSVPSYIGSGANITGRWVKGSLKMSIISNKWKCSVLFEKNN
jgi:hypothetical protein